MNSAASEPRAVAPVAFEDGLGERLYAVGAGNEPLEVLKISGELTWVSTFEESLRAQMQRLADFRHEAFGRVRAIERLNAKSSSVAIISDHVRGVRLSDVLAGAVKRDIVLEFPAAAWLIRQLASAVAAFHESGPGMCHGAIAPERIVVTPDGRLVLVEYILGPALEEMHFSWERYWRELGIALPRPIGLSRFDPAADVTQMGAVALALVLGRPLAADEYPHKVSEVLEGAAMRTAIDEEPLPAPFRAWLRRALHLEPRSAYASGLEAQAELELRLELDDVVGRASLRSFLSKYATAIAMERQAAAQSRREPVPLETSTPAIAEPVPVPPAPAPAPVAAASDDRTRTDEIETRSAAETVDVFASEGADTSWAPPVSGGAEPEPPPLTDFTSERAETGPSPIASSEAEVGPWPPADAVWSPVNAMPMWAERAADETIEAPVAAAVAQAPMPVAAARPAAAAVEPAHEDDDVDTVDDESSEDAIAAIVAPAARSKPIWASPWAIGVVLAIIAVTMGVTFLRHGDAAAPAAAEAGAPGTLEIATSPDGVTVLVDGTAKGVTPLSITVPAGAHVVELVNGASRRSVPVTVRAGAHMSQFLEMPKTVAQTGDLLVRTDPAKARVAVDGKAYGQSPVTVRGLSPGTHTVKLENESGTFSDEVVVEAGATASLVVPMTKPQAGANVSGWIAINAPADLQVFEGGRLIGSSRSDRIMVAVGRHDLELVNDTLGYRSSRSVEVAAGQVASVKPDWPKGTMAVNALPWAEVFIDGERAGETPIGSVTTTIGSHEIVFRHPELGERRATATVTTGAPVKVSVDMRAK